MLLRSRPDMVHEFLLRKTQMSSPLISGGSIKSRPLPNITPAIADCRYKVPLTPRLHGYFIINVIYQLCQVKLITYLTPVSYDTAFELLWLNWCKQYVFNTIIACCKTYLLHTSFFTYNDNWHILYY